MYKAATRPSILVALTGKRLASKCLRKEILIDVVRNGVRAMVLLEVRGPAATSDEILVPARHTLGDVESQRITISKQQKN